MSNILEKLEWLRLEIENHNVFRFELDWPSNINGYRTFEKQLVANGQSVWQEWQISSIIHCIMVGGSVTSSKSESTIS